MKSQSCTFPLLTLVLLVGCAQQGEGERCVRSNLDADCDSGLICVAADQLEQSYASGDGKMSDYAADRCCRSDEQNYGDARCKRKSSVSATGVGGSSSVGSGGSSGVNVAGSTQVPMTGGAGTQVGGEVGGAAGASAAPVAGATNTGTAGSGVGGMGGGGAGSESPGQAGTSGSAT